MDAASSPGTEYRICPVCDGLVVLTMPDAVVETGLPAAAVSEVEPGRILDNVAT